MSGWIFQNEITCSNCGKKYNLYKMSIPMRDKDSEECECGSTLIRWNGGVMYDARLIKDNK